MARLLRSLRRSAGEKLAVSTGPSNAWSCQLDADAILAGQAALAGQTGHTVTIATTNLAHLNRFPGMDAQIWNLIR